MKDLSEYKDCHLLILMSQDDKTKEQVLNVLWKRYSKKIFSFCLFITENNDEAEEIHQLTWIKFYEYIKSKNSVTNIESFLFSTASLISKEKHRQKMSVSNRNISIQDERNIVDPDNIWKKFEDEQLLAEVSLAIKYLDEPHKEVFLLKWFSELKYEDIAHIVGDTPDCVRMRCNRAMGKLIKKLYPVINDLNKGDL